MRYFLISIFLFINSLNFDKLTLEENFPIWLKDGYKHSDQTSGITFIGSKDKLKFFLICDDIGKIHKIKLNNDKLNIKTIEFENSVNKFLEKFEKKDFEEIVYDKFTNQVFISIEGNGKDYRNEVGIYKVRFKNDDVFSDEIIEISKVNFPEWDRISKFTRQNNGFEGFAVSRNRIFLGLEGFQFGTIFLDSTMLYIIDKNSSKLIKEISTKKFRIHTICGLYAVNDYHIYGVDRSQQCFFEIKFDKNYNVEKCELTKLDLPLPEKKNLRYVASIESIAIDDDKYVYVIDDPWKKFYVPNQKVLNQIKEEDKENFKKFIPLLFKYKLN